MRQSFAKKYFLFFLLLLNSSYLCRAESTYEIIPDIVCDPSTEYLDISSLACTECSDNSDNSGYNLNKVPDTADLDSNGNSLSCICDIGYAEVTISCSDSAMITGSCPGFSCVKCDERPAFSDGTGCAACGNGTLGYDAETMECICPVDDTGYPFVLAETDYGGDFINKTCAECKDGLQVIETDRTEAGVYYTADLYTCQACPDDQMSFNSEGKCVCADGYTVSGSTSIGQTVCLDETRVATVVTGWSESKAIQVDYYFVQEEPNGPADYTNSLDSLTFQHYYLWAATHCYTYRGPDDLKACQTLANLCVLQQYDTDKVVCDLIETIRTSRVGSVWQQEGWSLSLPWLYYVDTAATVTADRNIEMLMSFDERTGRYDSMVYKLAAYALNGSFLGMENLTTQFYYCGMEAPDTELGGGSNSPTTFLQFGHATTQEFQCDLSSLIGQENIFYDMYVLDQSTGYLYPVPVLNVNIPENGLFINQNVEVLEEIDDLYTRRFFLFDTVSGISSSSLENENGDLVPDIIRYAYQITLSVKIQEIDPESIYPPVLKVVYKEREPAAWDSEDEDYAAMQYETLTFIAEYTMDTEEFWEVTTAFFSVGIFFFAGITFVRWMNYQKRITRLVGQTAPEQNVFNFKTWFHRIAVACHSFVLVYFVLVFMICSYWFTFFKLQSTVYAMLPPNNTEYTQDNEYYKFYVFMHVLFFFHLIWIINVIIRQVTVDIFFMDWEKPKSNSGGRKKKGAADGVSVWRSLLCANEWNEMQAHRGQNIEFSLFWVAFFLIALDLQYNATPQPDLNDLTEDELNPALRVANTVWWWFIMALTQYLWKFLIYERCIVEPKVWRFIDMCTMAKVSCLVMDEKYHGYYIHCRSPHPHADVTMREMADCLSNEALGHRVNRGLEWASADVQTFEVFFTEKFRCKYNSIYNDIVTEEMELPFLNATGKLGELQMRANSRPKRKGPSSDRSLDAARNLNKFLQGFISRQYQAEELQCKVIQRGMWEKLLRIPPDMRGGNSPCIFIEDTVLNFKSVLLMGIEFDLLLLNILTFCICDIWFDNTMASVLLTYLLDKFFMCIRVYLGQKNLTGKTLVDERFLI